MEVLLAVIPPAVEALRQVAQEQGGSTSIAITDDGIKFLGAGIAMGLGAFGPALAIGNLVGRALDALGRNPEAQPVIQTNMILGLAFAEAIGIYALVTAVMIGFVF
jgi:F-type H+-transporting ATPase subunit c